jgi:pimeloyl-ACP methyl ester carboxylesterase
MSDTYVLVHGAWHTGAELEAAAENIRKSGHTVHCPTLAGNRTGDDRSRIGLMDAARSLEAFLKEKNLSGVRLVGHSYGGMVISQLMDIAPERVTRLVYVNAFVPNPGESLNDMVPPMYVAMFDQIAGASNGAVVLPFPIWREAFINDADAALARSSYEQLSPEPYQPFTAKLDLAAFYASELPRSYLNCTEDIALPPGEWGWHPRFSGRLGLCRLVQMPGSHEVLFTNPRLLAEKIVEAGRD